jgi:hypothetical protein
MIRKAKKREERQKKEKKRRPFCSRRRRKGKYDFAVDRVYVGALLTFAALFGDVSIL